MLHKSRGVVLRIIRYGETSVIAKVYTEKFGSQSYLINGVRKPKSKFPSSLLQPLSLIDMVVYYNERRDLQRLSEIKADYIYHDLPNNIIKSSIGLFIAELLYKAIPEAESNADLFEFIFNSLNYLDADNGSHSNFHIFFMAQLTKYLGFFPAGHFNEHTPYLDLQEGLFTTFGQKKNCLGSEASSLIHSFIHGSLESIREIQLSKEEKAMILLDMTSYYTFHLDHFKGINSIRILRELIN